MLSVQLPMCTPVALKLTTQVAWWFGSGRKTKVQTEEWGGSGRSPKSLIYHVHNKFFSGLTNHSTNGEQEWGRQHKTLFSMAPRVLSRINATDPNWLSGAWTMAPRLRELGPPVSALSLKREQATTTAWGASTYGDETPQGCYLMRDELWQTCGVFEGMSHRDLVKEPGSCLCLCQNSFMCCPNVYLPKVHVIHCFFEIIIIFTAAGMNRIIAFLRSSGLGGIFNCCLQRSHILTQPFNFYGQLCNLSADGSIFGHFVINYGTTCSYSKSCAQEN